MKVLKNLITLVILLGIATQINAQRLLKPSDSKSYKYVSSFIDVRCSRKYVGIVHGTSGKKITVDFSKAKSKAGDVYEDFTIKATPKKNDRISLLYGAVIAISQNGTWYKGIHYGGSLKDLSIACACNDLKYGSNFLYRLTETLELIDPANGPGPYISDFMSLQEWEKENYKLVPNDIGGLFIVEAKLLGEYWITTEIVNYKDLDPKYDWTIVWND
jgi:hypothetical protein